MMKNYSDPWTWKPASLFRPGGGVIWAVSSKGRILRSVAIPGCCLPRVHNHTPTCHLVIPRVLSERFELMHIGDQLAMRDDLPAGYEHYHQYKLYWKVLVDSSSYLLISLKRGLDYSNGHIKNKEKQAGLSRATLEISSQDFLQNFLKWLSWRSWQFLLRWVAQKVTFLRKSPYFIIF